MDFSAVSDAVVQAAAALARAFDGRVVLLTVVQPPVVITEYAAVADIAELTAVAATNAARKLEALEDKLKNAFIKADRIQAKGSPVHVILEQAEQVGADYIVMGSHGHAALYELLVGSTTHGVLTRAKCPVVIVPASRTASARNPKKRRLAAA